MTNLTGPTIQQLMQMGLLDDVNSLYGKTAMRFTPLIVDAAHMSRDGGMTVHKQELLPQNMGFVLTSSTKDGVPTDEDGRRFTVFYVDEAHCVPDCIPDGAIRPGDVLTIAGEAAKYVVQGTPSHDYQRQNRHERRKAAKLRRMR